MKLIVDTEALTVVEFIEQAALDWETVHSEAAFLESEISGLEDHVADCRNYFGDLMRAIEALENPAF